MATTLRVTAIVVLLPVGFVAGALTSTINPNELFGAAFTPMVSLAVAVTLRGWSRPPGERVQGHSQRIVRRLIVWGCPSPRAGAVLLAWLLLGPSSRAAMMLGAIQIVSGPTVVAPLLERARPGRRLTAILGWEGTTIDPIGAIIGALVFQALSTHVSSGRAAGCSISQRTSDSASRRRRAARRARHRSDHRHRRRCGRRVQRIQRLLRFRSDWLDVENAEMQGKRPAT